MNFQLDISYSVWKQVAQANGWATYYQNGGSTRVFLWTGDRDHIYRSQADGADFADWGSTFKSVATEVLKDDDSVAIIIGLTGLQPAPVAPGGVPVCMVAGPPSKFEKWSGGTKALSNTEWTEVYSLDGPGVLHGSFFQVNTHKLLVRIQFDSVIVVDLDLEELRNDFDFGRRGRGRRCGCVAWLQEYTNNHWQFKPPGAPSRFDASFKVLLKASQNNKKLYRGLTVWGPL